MNEEIRRRRLEQHRNRKDEKTHITHGVKRSTPKNLSFSEYIHSYKAYTAFLALLAYFVYFAFRIKYVYEAEFSSVSDQVVAYFYLLVEISLPLVRHNIDRILHIAAHNQRPIMSKAGNLNFAVAFTLRVRAQPTEFIAQLDADAIPKSNWLLTVVRHILSDERLSMVVAQPSFTNVPTSDPLYQLAHPPGAGALKAALGVSQSTGSGYIIRRSALASIGGFSHDISEDTSTSFCLMADGWYVTQVKEKLQYGLLPDTLWGHIEQRSRWVAANANLFPTINHLRRTGSLTTRQLLVAYSIVATALYYTLLPTLLAVLPLLLLYQRPLIPNSNLLILLPLATALVLTDTLHNQLLSLGPGSSLQLLSRSRDAQPWMCPFYPSKYLGLHIFQRSDHSISGKKLHGTPDADFNSPKYTLTSQLKRAFTISTDTKIIIGYTIYATTLLFAVLRIWFSNIPDDVSCTGSLPHEKYTFFLQHLFCVQRLFWPELLWLDPLRWALVPLYYAIWGDRAGTADDTRELLHGIWTVAFAMVRCLWGFFLCQNLCVSS